MTNVKLTDNLGARRVRLHIVVNEVDLEVPRPEDLAVDRLAFLIILDYRYPHVELGDPVLKCVHRHDDENGSGACVTKEDVDERDHLNGLAETHAVSQYTTKAVARLEALQRLHQVVVQKPDATDLPVTTINFSYHETTSVTTATPELHTRIIFIHRKADYDKYINREWNLSMLPN